MIPIIVLVVMNSLLIYEIVKASKTNIGRSQRGNSKRRSINVSVVISTIFFIVTNIPLTAMLFFFPQSFHLSTLTGAVLMRLAKCLQYFYHCSSFTILMITNELFRKETKEVFQKLFHSKTDILKENIKADTLNMTTSRF